MKNNTISDYPPKSEQTKVSPKHGSMLEFANPKGHNIYDKFKAFVNWQDERTALGSWTFGKVNKGKYELDYSLFDYMDLSEHPEVLNAAHQSINEYGISSSGSPSLDGRTALSEKLELKTKGILKKEACLLYPSGWAACFGAVTGITSSQDTILIDRLSHNCLAVAARSATKNVKKFLHNDMDDLAKQLKESRENDDKNALVIVLESLYSMNSTGPDLARVMELAKQYNALVILDVAHELGCYGDNGLGILNTVDISDDRLIIAGSYSKVFGTNGGFVAGHRFLNKHFIVYSPTYAFSSAMSPMQCGIILKSMDIAFSEEGKELRRKLSKLILYIRKKLKENDFEVDGDPSAIISIIIGAEEKSRDIYSKLLEQGLSVNLIEFPVVKRGSSLFRIMLSPKNTLDELDRTVEILRNTRDKYGI